MDAKLIEEFRSLKYQEQARSAARKKLVQSFIDFVGSVNSVAGWVHDKLTTEGRLKLETHPNDLTLQLNLYDTEDGERTQTLWQASVSADGYKVGATPCSEDMVYSTLLIKLKGVLPLCS